SGDDACRVSTPGVLQKIILKTQPTHAPPRVGAQRVVSALGRPPTTTSCSSSIRSGSVSQTQSMNQRDNERSQRALDPDHNQHPRDKCVKGNIANRVW
ncbi:unnamed protein product, partial [Ectocarpus sp. 13 AM-2016]